MNTPIDHLVYATPDLETGIRMLEERLGCRSTPGGRHPDWGTRNALFGLGPAAYLEVIGPDPDLPAPTQGRPFGIDALEGPRFVTWALKAPRLEEQVRQAAALGLILGPIREGRRRREDGSLLTWRLTDPYTVHADGLVPFLIDWEDSAHPARHLPQIGRLQHLRLEHPEPERTRALLSILDVDLPVFSGVTPRMSMTIRGNR